MCRSVTEEKETTKFTLSFLKKCNCQLCLRKNFPLWPWRFKVQGGAVVLGRGGNVRGLKFESLSRRWLPMRLTMCSASNSWFFHYNINVQTRSSVSSLLWLERKNAVSTCNTWICLITLIFLYEKGRLSTDRQIKE